MLFTGIREDVAMAMLVKVESDLKFTEIGTYVLKKHLGSICAASCGSYEVLLLQRLGMEVSLVKLSPIETPKILPIRSE